MNTIQKTSHSFRFSNTKVRLNFTMKATDNISKIEISFDDFPNLAIWMHSISKADSLQLVYSEIEILKLSETTQGHDNPNYDSYLLSINDSKHWNVLINLDMLMRLTEISYLLKKGKKIMED